MSSKSRSLLDVDFEFSLCFLAKSWEAKGLTYDVQDFQTVTKCRKEKGSNIQTRI